MAWAGGPVGPSGIPGRRRRGLLNPGFLVPVAISLIFLISSGGYLALSDHAGPVPTSTIGAGKTTPATPATSATPVESSGPTETSPAAPGSTAVAVSLAAQSNSAEPQVLAWAVRYFTAINTHDYQAYVGLLGPQLASGVTPASFTNGFGTVRDSAVTLTGITDQGGGYEAATVSLTSHQNPSQSVNGQDSCDLWTITLYLAPSGSSYVQVPAPAGYTSSHQAC